VVIKTHPFAEIIYWGPQATFCRMCSSRARLPTAGWMSIPGHADGRAGPRSVWAPGIEGIAGLDGSPVFTTAECSRTGNTLTITAEDEHAGLRLTSELALDASGVLVVRHGLTNLKAQPWQVDRFAVTLPVAERARR
jgi:alpha-galactosidase